MDLSTGEIIFRKNNVNDASFVGNSDNVAVLIGDDLKVYPLDKSKKASKDDEGDFEPEFKKRLKIEEANNSFSISPDGKILAVARKVNDKDIKNIATLRSDKKAQKYALKYKYVVDFYNTESLKLLYTSDESFDIIFDMRFTADGGDVILFSKAHSKVQTAGQGFINLLDASNGTIKRAMFSTFAPMPDYKESPDKKMMGVLTRDTDNNLTAGSILWFNYETARSIGKFDVDMRFGESLGTNGRTYFTFLPDGHILSSYGHKLAYIKIK